MADVASSRCILFCCKLRVATYRFCWQASWAKRNKPTLCVDKSSRKETSQRCRWCINTGGHRSARSPSNARVCSPTVQLHCVMSLISERGCKLVFRSSAGPMSLVSLSACLAILFLQVALESAFELTLRRKAPGPEPVPRGQPHHIYKVPACSADELKLAVHATPDPQCTKHDIDCKESTVIAHTVSSWKGGSSPNNIT